MASQLDIANWALTMLGEKRISALSDDTDNAELILGGWNMLRDALLVAQGWRFAIERTSLAADTATPAWGFDYQYTVPGHVVRVLQVGQFYPGPDMSDYRNSDGAEYRIEQGRILTNEGAPLYVKWLINTVDIGSWHPAFAKLMACDIADYVQPRAVQSDAAAQRIAFNRSQAWMLAGTTNAIEDPPDYPADDTWLAAHAS
ncbi:MAG: hypothetical protein AB7O04_12575 [Hyphomonadaceae bacterium]